MEAIVPVALQVVLPLALSACAVQATLATPRKLISRITARAVHAFLSSCPAHFVFGSAAAAAAYADLRRGMLDRLPVVFLLVARSLTNAGAASATRGAALATAVGALQYTYIDMR